MTDPMQDERRGRAGQARWMMALLMAALTACDPTGRAADAGSTGRTAGDGKASRPAAPDTAARAGAETRAGAGTPESAPRTIVFAGTSLTAGLGLDPENAYPQLVARKIDSAGLPYEVVNAGVSGETTAGLLRRLDWLVQGGFDVLVIESGANDGLRGIPVATMKRNLTEIVRRVRAERPAATVMLAQMEAPPNLGRAYTAAFHQVYVDLARDAGVMLLPFILDGVAGTRQLNQADGIHPNLAGERIVADNVWRALRPALERLAREASSPAARSIGFDSPGT